MNFAIACQPCKVLIAALPRAGRVALKPVSRQRALLRLDQPARPTELEDQAAQRNPSRRSACAQAVFPEKPRAGEPGGACPLLRQKAEKGSAPTMRRACPSPFRGSFRG
jgi:hypothetical protein